MKRIAWLLCLLAAPALWAQQPPALQTFGEFFKRATAFAAAYPVEKVHLHFDNTSYYCGDTIWFKAYVTQGPDLQPTQLSRPLYVELVDQLGHVTDRQIVKVENGQGHGQIVLEKSGLSGYYEVRAFTKWMLAFDGQSYFSRTFPVYRLVSDAGKDRSIGTYRMNDYMEQRPREERDEVSVRFFPEGGQLVEGIPSIVAFKAESRTEGNISVTGTVKRADGEAVAQLATLHDGMGFFSYTPQPGQQAEAEVSYGGKSYRFALPEPLPAGCVLNVSNRDSLLDVRVFRSGEAADTLALFVSHQGVPLLWKPLALAAKGAEMVRFRTADFPAGLLQFSLMNRSGAVVAERLVYAMPRSQGIRLHASVDRQYYQPYSPVRCRIEAKDAQGRPLETTLSVAIRSQSASDYMAYDNTLYTDLLLTSDLKGYIHQPGYYFAGQGRDRKQALDLLLLVHGWRKYDLAPRVQQPPVQPRYLPEKQLTVHGRLKSYVLKRDMENLEVSVLARRGGEFLAGSALSDSLGCFQIPVEDFEGTMTTSIQTRKPGAKRKQLASVLLDRNFAPALRPYDYYEQHPDYSDPEQLQAQAARYDSLYWDSLRKHNPYLLADVTVQGRYRRKRTRVFEETIRAYYDVQRMVNEMRDRGEEVFTLPDFLNHVDPAIRLLYDDTSSPRITYNGQSLAIALDGSLHDFKYTSSLITDDIDAIQTLMICHGASAGREVGVVDLDSWLLDRALEADDEDGYQFDLTHGQLPPICYLVTIDGWNANRDLRPKRGIRTTQLQGYNPPLEFYSPAYGTDALPPGMDKRRTLYWNPLVRTDKNGCAVVECCNNDVTSGIIISAETICNGQPAATVTQSVAMGNN